MKNQPQVRDELEGIDFEGIALKIKKSLSQQHELDQEESKVLGERAEYWLGHEDYKDEMDGTGTGG